MKNVHVIPIEKESTGYILGKCIKELSDVKIGQFVKTHYMLFDKEYFQPQSIYITSDEDIKEEDWCLGMDGIFQYKGKVNLPDVELPKKIILTTDQDLIADGVQSIDDEFLEWFVKNPICESVVVVNDEYVDLYKIITPEEEPEQTDEKGRPVTYWGSLQEPKQEWSPSQGEEVWIKVFSNWLKGRYIGYDVTEQVHIAREDKKYGRYLSSSKMLPYYAMPNEPESETQDFKVWDELFGILAWKFQPTKSGDMFLDAEKVFEELKSKFKLERL
jgi:hypothetical protein